MNPLEGNTVSTTYTNRLFGEEPTTTQPLAHSDAQIQANSQQILSQQLLHSTHLSSFSQDIVPLENPFPLPSAPPLSPVRHEEAPFLSITDNLLSVYNTLGDRAIGTYVIVPESNNVFELHLIDKDGLLRKFDYYQMYENVVINGMSYPSIEAFLRIAAPTATGFYTLESRIKQIETIQSLQQKFSVTLDDISLRDLAEPFILVESDFVKINGRLAQIKTSPFVLRTKNLHLFKMEMESKILEDINDERKRQKTPTFELSTLESYLRKLGNGCFFTGLDKKAKEMASASCGDFQLVGVYFCRTKSDGKTTEKEFLRRDPIFVLPDGKIQHGHGRTYNNFEELKKDWSLGDFLFDAYKEKFGLDMRSTEQCEIYLQEQFEKKRTKSTSTINIIKNVFSGYKH